MSQLNQTPAVPLATGILNPKLKNRFAVHIQSSKADSLECLTDQIVAVKKIVEERNVFFGIESGSFQLIVEDDVTGKASRAINDLRTLDFAVRIDILDGMGSTTESINFGGCRVQKVRYSDLDYSAPKGGRFINVDIPSKVGNAVEHLKENHPEAYAIFLALSGTNISLSTKSKSAVVHHTLEISFNKLTKTFY